MRCVPTQPLEFARPWGNALDFEFRSSFGVSTPLAQTTTAFARWNTSALLPSKYFTPVTRPFDDSSIFRTYELGRTSHRPVATAFGIVVTNELPLARTSQPNPRHRPHWTHPERPSYSVELIAIGAGNAVHPIFFAPRSSSTPVDL